MRPLTADLDAAEREILTDIDSYGCHIVLVDGDEHGPGYAFSVGLWHRFQQPEVAITGLPAESMHTLLNLIAEDAEAGKRYADGDSTDDLLHGYPVTFRSVPASHRRGWFGIGVWAYEGADFPVLQMVYPDKHGRYPWQPGVGQGFLAAQPLIAAQPADPLAGGAAQP